MDFLSALGQPLQAFMDMLDVPQDIIQGAQARGRQQAAQPIAAGPGFPVPGYLAHDPTGIMPMLMGMAGYGSDVATQGFGGANEQTGQLDQQQPDLYPGEKMVQGFAPNVLPFLAGFVNPVAGAAEGLALASKAFPAMRGLAPAAKVAHTAAELSYLPYAAGMAGDISGNDNAYGLGSLATLAALAKAPRINPRVLAPIDAGLDLYRSSKVQNQNTALMRPVSQEAQQAVNTGTVPLTDEQRARFLAAAMGSGGGASG